MLLLQRVQHELGDSYEVERELDGGGMSRVLVARDRRLDRRVVVKLLRPEMAAGMSVERFRREILTAAALQHPHIVPILSAGEMDGLPYFLMPYVDGESLRVRLEAGPMPVRETVRILRDVARALSVAHERGIVHRDVKPDNVLLSGGAAMVADFGVAKAVASARGELRGGEGEARGPMTTAGTSLGTPQYMAPEQVVADPTTDGRADLYALGVMAYEMLAGAPPFAGRTPQGTVVAHLTERPAPLASHRGDVPALLDDLVMRCLEKDPDRRPQSADEVAAALEDPAAMSGASAVPSGPAAAAARRARMAGRARRWSAVAAAVAVVIAGTVAGAHRPPAPSTPPVAAPKVMAPVARTAASVAILPFVYSGPDTGRAGLAVSVADALTGSLARLPGLHVASRARSVALQKRIATGDTTALPVTSLVEGVVEQEGQRLRLSLRLVATDDGFTVWADSFEGRTTDVFAMEDAAAAAMRDALRDHFRLPSDESGARPVPSAAPRTIPHAAPTRRPLA